MRLIVWVAITWIEWFAKQFSKWTALSENFSQVLYRIVLCVALNLGRVSIRQCGLVLRRTAPCHRWSALNSDINSDINITNCYKKIDCFVRFIAKIKWNALGGSAGCVPDRIRRISSMVRERQYGQVKSEQNLPKFFCSLMRFINKKKELKRKIHWTFMQCVLHLKSVV